MKKIAEHTRKASHSFSNMLFKSTRASYLQVDAALVLSAWAKTRAKSPRDGAVLVVSAFTRLKDVTLVVDSPSCSLNLQTVGLAQSMVN